ncbi:hypothetical protein BCR34DRAFT_494304 [Clohesyomyces aquaticus]|uniref:Uncharacterized protein n=1 Tax=Clohesyomyces aquaticus TaxID=1231657 RepID=A0A1Y1YS69_9PLEO|nr:hypothetical protein BCR34DRAFT_494304 [Clohesyomyces aquaticus]
MGIVSFQHVPARIPVAGSVISIILSMVTFAVLAVCLTRRVQAIVQWKSLPFSSWLILAIYIDSTLFVFVTAIVSKGLGINDSQGICDGAILLCLICYMTTKYIIRGSRVLRMKDRLYLFNFFGVIVPYLVVIVMNFVFRIAYINDKGVCIIGMQKISMIPLISFDVLINVYMTLLFLIPLRKLYSYQNSKNTSLHKVALRTFLGSCATLISSVANLTILMVLKGEPGWICLMCCNADILFSVLVLHWVTSLDGNRSLTSSHPQSGVGATGSRTTGGVQVQRGSTFLSNSHARPNSPHNLKDGQGHKFGTAVNVWPDHEQIAAHKKGMGMVTTECLGSVHGERERSGSQDEIMEMHKITVKTEHVREVEIDGASEGSEYREGGALEMGSRRAVRPDERV